MADISALYVNVYATPRWWFSPAIRLGGALVGFVGRFSIRAADLLAASLIALCVRFGYVVEVRR